jgi:hypothetical protein
MSDPVKKPPRRKTHPDTILIIAQIGLTIVLLGAIIGIVAALLLLKGSLSGAQQSTATNIILVLTTLLTVSWNYFFSRQRPSGLPDPNEPGANHALLSTGGTITVTGNKSGPGGGTG